MTHRYQTQTYHPKDRRHHCRQTNTISHLQRVPWRMEQAVRTVAPQPVSVERSNNRSVCLSFQHNAKAFLSSADRCLMSRLHCDQMNVGSIHCCVSLRSSMAQCGTGTAASTQQQELDHCMATIVKLSAAHRNVHLSNLAISCSPVYPCQHGELPGHRCRDFYDVVSRRLLIKHPLFRRYIDFNNAFQSRKGPTAAHCPDPVTYLSNT